MKVTYDDEASAIYIYIQEPKPGITKRTIELDGGDFKATINLDLDAEDNPVGFEILLDDPTPEGRKALLKHFEDIES